MRCCAFLRGINLGGRCVTGPQLCAPFEELGLWEVSSFLASGNVVFDAGLDDTGLDEATRELEARLEAALEEVLGFPVETSVRTGVEVAQVVARQPFPAEAIAGSTGKPQVTFLRRAPSEDVVEEVLACGTDDDRLTVIGREWYWLPAGGISRSTLDVAAIERLLDRGTTRTHNTVSRLQATYALGVSD